MVAAGLLRPSDIAIPAIVAYEVWVGVLGSRNAAARRTQFEQFLAMLDVLPFDVNACARAAELRHALELKGQSIGPLDTLIAATALVNNGTLVTHNTREFSRVKGLTLVDWFV